MISYRGYVTGSVIQVISVACVTKSALPFVLIYLVKRVMEIVLGNVRSDTMGLTVHKGVVRIATIQSVLKHLEIVSVVPWVCIMVRNVKLHVECAITKVAILKQELVLDHVNLVIMGTNVKGCVIQIVNMKLATAQLQNVLGVKQVFMVITAQWFAVQIALYDNATKIRDIVPKIAPLVDGVKLARMNVVRIALKTNVIAALAIVLLAMTVSTVRSVSSPAVHNALLEHVNAA